MITLSKLELSNFLSHVNTNISLEDYKGLVLVEGQTHDGHYSSNGSGKSSLLEGVVYALTGDTLRGVSVNDVVNRNYNKDMRVSLEFMKDDTLYNITRYRKDENFGDSIFLTKDGENISKRVNKETQKYLEDIIGISYKVLVSTILLGEGLSSRFTQLSDPEKKSLIESTLNLNYDMNAIRSLANSKLSSLKLEKSNLEGKLSTLNELASLDLELTRNLVQEKEAKAVKTNQDIEGIKSELENLRATTEETERKLTLISDSINNIRNLTRELGMYQSELERLKSEYNSISNSESPRCTVCHQELQSTESRNAFSKSYEERMNATTIKMSEIEKSISNFPDLSLLESKYTLLVEARDMIKNQVREKEIELNRLSNEYWIYQSEVTRLTDDMKKYESSQESISDLETSLKNLDIEIYKYEYFYKLFSPTGIIVNILSDAIDYINTRLATYSEVLLEKSYRLEFVKGKISLVDTKGSNYQSLSNGEKRRLDIAIQFSLHDYCMKYCGMQVDSMFIDEVLDTLDDVGTNNIMEVLRMKLDYCGLSRIFVISHNDQLKSYFDNVITVVKDEKGNSSIK